jgi:hypothetical protein
MRLQSRLQRVLLIGLLVVAGLGLAAELWYASARSDRSGAFAELFSLSYEGNVPTWYATCLLFSCGLALVEIATQVSRSGARFRGHWWFLAITFFYMSLDELVGIHENLADLVPAGGVLYFNWVIPAGVAVALFGLAYLPFLLHLPGDLRRRFVIAGIIYVSGALLMELPLGYWTERAGSDNLTYALIDLVEECLEIIGASLFLLALREHHAQPQRSPDTP